MSDSQNPFAGASSSAGVTPRGVTVAWVIAVVMALAALTLGLLWSRDKSRLESQLAVLRGTVTESAAELARATAERQTNRNLILSREAEATSLPNLEIGANDVRCTHGGKMPIIHPSNSNQERGRNHASCGMCWSAELAGRMRYRRLG